MSPENPPTDQLTLDRIREELPDWEAGKDVLAWVEAHPQGWQQRLAEFDDTIATLNRMVSGQAPLDLNYHTDVAVLKQAGVSPLPTLKELACLPIPGSSPRDRVGFSCRLIGKAFQMIREEMVPGGSWHWLTEITEPHQALSGLLIEGYGLLLSRARVRPGFDLQRTFVLGFEEVLWTKAKQLAWDKQEQLKLLNDVVPWVVEEKGSFPAAIADEVTSHTRYNRRWGDGQFLGDDPTILYESPEGLARAMAWSQACPNPKAVMAEYGVIWTLQRYAECNFCYGLIFAQAERYNPALALELTRGIWRPDGEPVGAYDPLAAPQMHRWLMSRLSTPWGYALPRVLIEQFGRADEKTDQRILRGLNILERVTKTAQTPQELLARLANAVIKADAQPEAVLGHVLAVELEHEGAGSALVTVAQALKRHAPRLWQYYESLSPDKRQEDGMIASP